MSTPAFDVPRAHRYFAVELNNIAWDLIEATERSPFDIERMLHAAHGSCFHWLQVGDVLNHLRAQCLLATAYTKAALPDAALRYADRAKQLSTEAADKQTPFDRATAHGCAASAYKLAGRIDEARAEYRQALAFTAMFDDPSELPAFERLFPKP